MPLENDPGQPYKHTFWSEQLLFDHMALIIQGVCKGKQNALRRDCIYDFENMDLEIGGLGVYLHFL